MSGVKLKYANCYKEFCVRMMYLSPFGFFVITMLSQRYSLLYTFIVTVEFMVLQTLGYLIIYIFLKNFFRILRRTCSCFKKGSAKTIKELLLEADHQVRTDWTVAEQVGKFYLKDFCRLLKKQYMHQKIGLFLAGSVGERFGKPICSDLGKCKTDLITNFDYMVYLKGISAVTVIETDSDIYIQTKEKGIMNGYAKLYCTPNLASTFPTERGGVLSAGNLLKKLNKPLGNTDMSFYPGFQQFFCCYDLTGQIIDFQQNGPALCVQIQTTNSWKSCFLPRKDFIADIVFSIYSPE